MNFLKISPKFLIVILLTIFFAVSLILRIVFPYQYVFSGEWIKFTTNDAYYQMRIVDYVVHNFPHLSQLDPYLGYPISGGFGNIHFFNWLLSAVIWIISLGKFNQHTVDIIGVYFPPVLAALTTIPVYFIGKELFGKWAGVLAAALIAILPGQFLLRSTLGSTDQHIAEALFSTVSVLFLIVAIKEAGKQHLGLTHFIKRDWKAISKPLIFSLLGGAFLGIYLITWLGGFLFVFIISLYLVIQFIVDHLRRQSPVYLGIVGFVFFLVAAAIFLPFTLAPDLRLGIMVAVLLPLFLAGLSKLFSKIGLKTGYYPLAFLGVAIIFLAGLYAKDPNLLRSLADKFTSIFLLQGYSATTTSEMQPFLYLWGNFTTQLAWENFTTSFFMVKSWPIPGFAIISFIILIWLFIKHRCQEKLHLLLIIWTIVILAATLMQSRFAYYLAINVALLSGYISWQFIWLGGIRKISFEISAKIVKPPEKRTKEKRGKRGKEIEGVNIYYVRAAGVILAVFLIFFLFNILVAKKEASMAPLAPSDAWEESLHWVKVNTPEPLGDPDAYFQHHIYDYLFPESAYGVTSWWDYGYWISRTARRLPTVNPSQNTILVTKVADLFITQDEASARPISKSLNSKYIISDGVMVISKYWSIVTWAGHNKEEFHEDYVIPQDGKLVTATAFYPEYYRSFLVRLYNFDGKAVLALDPTVIAFVEKAGQDGKRYKQVTDAKKFSSYEEAIKYVATAGPSNHRLIGTNPFISPVPLEALQNYRLAHSSGSTTYTQYAGIVLPEVKIFEYTGD